MYVDFFWHGNECIYDTNVYEDYMCFTGSNIYLSGFSSQTRATFVCLKFLF